MLRVLGSILLSLLAHLTIVDTVGIYYEEVSETDFNPTIEGSMQRIPIINKSFHQCSIAPYCNYVIKTLSTGYFSTYNSTADLSLNRTGLRIWKKMYHGVNRCHEDACTDGACIKAISGYKCKCNPGFTGKNCEIALKGCYGLKARDPSLPSGLYQINGSTAGIENLVVYCDMETDGGGWTQVLNVSSTTNNFTIFVADGLNYITNLSAFRADKKYGMTSSALKTLRSIIGFTQFRFKCQANGSKLLHMETKSDNNGYRVVDCVTNGSSPDVCDIPSCGTFNRLPNDNSRIAKQCQNWRWRSDYDGNKWLMHHLMYIPFVSHWNIAVYERYECDDDRSSKIWDGEYWEVYVR